MSQETIKSKINDLAKQLSELKNQRGQLEQQISSIENQTLRQRLQDNLDTLLIQILDKEMEVKKRKIYIYAQNLNNLFTDTRFGNETRILLRKQSLNILFIIQQFYIN
jgi:regulator of replication initiation timing